MKIVKYPDPLLRQKCEPVNDIDDNLRSVLDQMLETMYQARGIGLAGPQVGIKKRITVIDLGEEEGQPKPLKLINPEIIDSSGSVTFEEGCLSIPEIRAKVTRPSEILVRALDETGKELEFEASELLAVCIQHEIDHLNGVLFIDKLSSVKRQMIQKQLRKMGCE